MRRILYATLALLTLTACDGSAASPQAGAAGAAPSSASITDCGTFTLPLGESLPGAAAQCLVDAARAGRAARLMVTQSTDEGDPIPVTYTAGTDRTVEVITDSRQDKFGVKVVTRQVCTGPVATNGGLDFAECSPSTPI